MSFLELLIRFDQELFKWIYVGLRPESNWVRGLFDSFFLMGNNFGELLIVVPILICLWWACRSRPRFFARVFILGLGLFVASGTVALTKYTMDRSRPARVFTEPSVYVADDRIPLWRQHRVRDATHPDWFTEFLYVRVDLADVHRPLLHGRSFPSGHAQFAFSLATALTAWFAMLRVPLFAWAILSMLARIYGGHHFPFDVIVGAFIGWAGVAFVFWGVGRIVRRERKRAGPTAAWASWLESGLGQAVPEPVRLRAWSKRLALIVAVVLYPVLVAGAVAWQAPGPFADVAAMPVWLIGPVVVAAYVFGWRGVLAIWRRRRSVPSVVFAGGAVPTVLADEPSGNGARTAVPYVPSMVAVSAPCPKELPPTPAVPSGPPRSTSG